MEKTDSKLMKCDMHNHSWHTKGILVSGKKSGTWYEQIFDSLRRTLKGKPDPKVTNFEFYFRPGVTPLQSHLTAKSNGMDFSCITDTNCIDGYLQLLNNHPGLESEVISGVEIEGYIPGKDFKIHVLSYGFSEQDFREMIKLTKNIADVKAYCDEKGILTSLAHPLTPWYLKDLVPDKKTLEYLLNLFPVIEARNGLTRKQDNLRVEEYCTETGKAMTAGTDSSTGEVGKTWIGVKTDKILTKQEFLEALKQGRGIPGGVHGGVNTIAHSLRKHADISNDVYYQDDQEHQTPIRLDVSKNPVYTALDSAVRTGVKLGSRAIAQWGYRELDKIRPEI